MCNNFSNNGSTDLKVVIGDNTISIYFYFVIQINLVDKYNMQSVQ